jgi:hypothetical protein
LFFNAMQLTGCPFFERSAMTTHNQDLLGKCFSSGVDTPARLLLNKANVTEEAALSQLREAYRGTGSLLS